MKQELDSAEISLSLCLWAKQSPITGHPWEMPAFIFQLPKDGETALLHDIRKSREQNCPYLSAKSACWWICSSFHSNSLSQLPLIKSSRILFQFHWYGKTYHFIFSVSFLYIVMGSFLFLHCFGEWMIAHVPFTFFFETHVSDFVKQGEFSQMESLSFGFHCLRRFWGVVLSFVCFDEWSINENPFPFSPFSLGPMFLNQFMHFLKSIHTFRRKTPFDCVFEAMFLTIL